MTFIERRVVILTPEHLIRMLIGFAGVWIAAACLAQEPIQPISRPTDLIPLWWNSASCCFLIHACSNPDLSLATPATT